MSAMLHVDYLQAAIQSPYVQSKPCGRFITFEGIKGIGKTTQVNFAQRALARAGVYVNCRQFEAGILSDSSLTDYEALALQKLAYFAQAQVDIKEALPRGLWELADGYVLQQLVKLQFQPSKAYIEDLWHEKWKSEPQPDAVFLLYGDVKLIEARSKINPQFLLEKQAAFISHCVNDPKVTYVPSDMRTPEEVFKAYIGPVLEDRFKISICYDELFKGYKVH